MTDKLISKVVEVDCDKDKLFEAIYNPEIWEKISPVKKIKIEFIGPNVFHSEMVDEIDILKIPIEMSGDLVLEDKGEVPDKGRLIELNVRNNDNVKKLEGRIRLKSIDANKTKVGVFVHNFALASNFLNIMGDAGELVLRRKISELLRNLQSYCKSNEL
ncbi:MAG: SRPBCC family protein [Candidatus Lokiarchaeota archaeon]|nr:SRPBCC family protein [Candidatus Lokiarchaeota archaeon]